MATNLIVAMTPAMLIAAGCAIYLVLRRKSGARSRSPADDVEHDGHAQAGAYGGGHDSGGHH